MTAHPKRDIHAEITAKLIAAIEANPGEPTMPWRRSAGPLWLPVNALTAKRYNGINVVSLWVAAETAGYGAPVWATYRQWAELGAQVRKGERASPIVFYKSYTTDPDPQDEEDDGTRRVARASWVFNAAQVDDYTPPDAPEPLGPIERIARADRFFAATGAKVVHGGEQAFYRPSTDTIHMPDEALFVGTATMTRSEAYFAVLGHEHIHWSGHGSRLDRNLSKRFAKAELAAEELVAEIGACVLCAELQITPDVRPDHAQYLAHWLKLLKDDDRAIFTAAAKAAEAVNYLKGLQPHAPDAGTGPAIPADRPAPVSETLAPVASGAQP
jgi:antirestriction protein ArdC